MFALLGRLCCNYSARIDAMICPLAVLLLVSCRICDKREDTAAISVDSSDKASVHMPTSTTWLIQELRVKLLCQATMKS